jgi:organic radical activating enzyme
MGEADGIVSEIFRSFQGEGIHPGTPQIFIRFTGCDRSCRFCDTPDSREVKGEKTRIHLGGGKRWLRPNPWRPVDLAEQIDDFGPLPLWLTGGEPLLQAEFLASFLPRVAEKHPVGLESHGLHFGVLASVLPHLRWIAAEAKLPSSTGEPLDWDAFTRFISIGREAVLFVKAVITASTDPGEVVEMFRRVHEVDGSTPVVLQPVTPAGGAEAPEYEVLETLALQGLELLHDVRVVPQIHKFAGWR